MKQKISNEKEFQENLKKLSDLYETGKALTTKLLPLHSTKEDLQTLDELRFVLREMRDLAAVQMQRNHFVDEN